MLLINATYLRDFHVVAVERGYTGCLVWKFVPFAEFIVALIVSSLLRQRLVNNFAAQEEGKSQS